MSSTARLLLFGVTVLVGAVLAALKIISGDAWLTLTLGLLLPSPFDGKLGKPSGPAIGSGISVMVPILWVFAAQMLAACRGLS